MIPEDHKVTIVTNGLHFMRAITEAYGAEEGMKLWETIADALDPDVKGQIFFAMITGEYNNRITLRGYHMGSNKVSLIKAVRSVDCRGPGLKEAKDVVDALEFTGKHQLVEVVPANYAAGVKELRNAGFIV